MTYKLFDQSGRLANASTSLGEVMVYGLNNLKFYFITNAEGAVIVNEMKGRKLPKRFISK